MRNLPSQRNRADKANVIVEAVIVLLLLISAGPPGCQEAPDPTNQTPDPARHVVQRRDSTPSVRMGLPRLVDLGAGKCIPCKKMAPILEELKEEYAGSLEVVFIDVWQDPSAGQKYGIESIPTQIFYDRSGKELFRHEGFFAKEDILAKWKELGVDIRKKDL